MSDQWLKTVCRICENGCGMLVQVKNGFATHVKGDPDDPRTEGLLCTKGMAALSLVYSNKRLLQPIVRVGKRGEGKWKSITWTEALKKIVNALDLVRNKYGAKAISLYRGQAPDWGAPWHYALRFMSLLGSPNICSPSHLCAQPRVAANVATYGGVLLPDWEHTKCVVIWGSNPSETNKHCIKGEKINNALDRGANLIVIDPIKNFFSKKADLWLQINPGTDCALALALINVIITENMIDESFVREWTAGFDQLRDHALRYSPEEVAPIVGVIPEKIREAARIYATNRPGIIYDGNGLDQHENVVGTTQAVSILRSIVGNIDVRGGEVFPTPVKSQFITLIEKLPESVKPLGGYQFFFEVSRQVPPPVIIDAILNEEPYPIKAMLVQGGNPAITLANSRRTITAIKKLDFIAVMDLFVTRTAQYADIVLPASTFLETSGLTAYPGLRTNYLRIQKKAVDPLGDSWPDWKFWFELGKGMGFTKEFSWQSVEDAINEQLRPSGFTFEAVENEPIRFQLREKKYGNDGFNTPSGKVELCASLLQKYGYKPLPDHKDSSVHMALKGDQGKKYPLIGTSWPRTATYIHTALRNIPTLRQLEPEPLVMINALDAENRRVKSGDHVMVGSVNGEIKVRACITDEILNGVVGLTWGWGEAVPEANMNDLTDDSIREPICGATLNREFLCEVWPIQAAQK